MKNNIILIICAVIFFIIFGICYFIAYTGRESAIKQESRTKCLLNQFNIVRSLYKYEKTMGEFPENLETLYTDGIMDKIACPVTKEDYCYEVTADRKNFTLSCSYTPFHSGDPYHHKPFTGNSDRLINNQLLQKIGYSYVLEQYIDDSNVNCIYITSKSYLIRLKDHRLGDTLAGAEKLKKIKEIFKKNGVNMDIEYSE